MTKSETNIGVKKESVIIALLSTRTIEEAARKANIPLRTVHRWLKEPAFQAAYRKAKSAVLSQQFARMHQMISPAVTTLGKIMVDSAAPAASRIRAAECILAYGAKAIELEELEERLSKLERINEFDDSPE